MTTYLSSKPDGSVTYSAPWFYKEPGFYVEFAGMSGNWADLVYAGTSFIRKNNVERAGLPAILGKATNNTYGGALMENPMAILRTIPASDKTVTLSGSYLNNYPRERLLDEFFPKLDDCIAQVIAGMKKTEIKMKIIIKAKR